MYRNEELKKLEKEMWAKDGDISRLYKKQARKSFLWGLPYKQDSLHWSYYVCLNKN